MSTLNRVKGDRSGITRSSVERLWLKLEEENEMMLDFKATFYATLRDCGVKLFQGVVSSLEELCPQSIC